MRELEQLNFDLINIAGLTWQPGHAKNMRARGSSRHFVPLVL